MAQTNGKRSAPNQTPPVSQPQTNWLSLNNGIQVLLEPSIGSDFEVAKPVETKVRVGIYGVGGSGKSRTSLEIARGLAGDGVIAVIDTERRARHYARQFQFLVKDLEDHSPTSWIQSIQAAEDEGAAVIILDSFSHAWMGRGGLQEYHQSLLSPKLDSFSAWNLVNPVQRALQEAITLSSAHIIATFQAKTEWDRFKENGTTKIQAVGLGPLWRQGIEYIFDFFGQIDATHMLRFEKEMDELFGGNAFPYPDQQLGESLKAWATDGDRQIRDWRYSVSHNEALNALKNRNNWSADQIRMLFAIFNSAAKKFTDICVDEISYRIVRRALGLRPEKGLEYVQEMYMRLQSQLEAE